MIVKTGANYQAEGGYIEASKTGSDVTVTIDRDDYIFNSDALDIASFYHVNVSLADGMPGGNYCNGLVRDHYGNYAPTGATLQPSSIIEKYAASNVGVYLGIGGTTGISNPALAEGSRNTIIEKITETAARIYATGPDAVAIIKEAE